MSSGLQIADLRVNVGQTGNDIVDEVNLTIQPGQVLGLVGESGSGKTTVGLAVLGHARRGVQIVSGRILVDGTSVLNLDDAAKRKMRGNLVSYVPQDPAASLNPALRIGVQLREALQAHDYGGSDKAREVRLKEMMAEVLLPSDDQYLRRYPHQLSGGQQQRVGLAMAFACRPAVIVLDEPTTGLDVTTQEHVLKTIRRLTTEHLVGALYITHDLAVIADLADEVAVMYAGRVVEQGAVREIFSAPAHPYTRHLVAAAPEIRDRREIIGLSGRAPAPGKRPGGCAFALRCSLVTDSCRTAFPAVVDVGDKHSVRCIRATELGKSDGGESRSAKSQVASADRVLELHDVSASYGAVTVVEAVSLAVRVGQCVALVGESGSGKTTVARCISGLHQHWTGSIRFSGRELEKEAQQRQLMDRLGIQYVFQNPYGSLNPRRTAGESIVRPLIVGGSSHADAQREMLEVLEKVSLPPAFANKFPDQMSGGERQRVAIARALMSKPQILVCDEVTSALDVLVQAAIIELLESLRHQMGLGILFITHNLPLVRSIADEVAVMANGRIVEHGDAETVIGNPQQQYTQKLITATPSIARSMH